MDKLVELLNALKDAKLDKTYNRIITDIADIKSALSVVNEEVNDAILALLSEGKYEDVNKLTPIPAVSSNVVVRLENLLNDFVEEVKIGKEIKSIKSKKVEIEEKPSETNILQYSGIITSVKGLRIGAQVVHKSFGVGKVISLEDTQNGNGKVLRVLFDSCGEKPFSCTPEILAKYFDITDKDDNKEDNNKEDNNSERTYEVPEHLKGVFSKVENIILRQNIKVVKERMVSYYKYTLNGKVICTISGANKKFDICFNIPYGKMIDTKGLLEDVSNKGHHGIGPYRLKVDEQTSLADIENFVKQTFNYYKYQ